MPANILAVRFSSLGDLLLTTPLLRAIKRRHPDARVTFVVREDMADTLRHNPNIDTLVAWPRQGALFQLARQLRGERWTHRLDLHGSLRSRVLRQLVGGRWHGYAKHRFRRRLIILTQRRLGGELGPVAERYFEAAAELDVSPDSGGLDFTVTSDAHRDAAHFLAQHRMAADDPLLVLAPGAAHFTKRWPTRHWIALARELSAVERVVVVGGEAESGVADAIVAANPDRIASAAGRFSLQGTAALLARARRVIAGDTGVLHLATAVRAPVVGLYGPTVREFGFFPYHARATAVELDLRCRPCSSQGGPICPLGHHHCLEQLEPATVIRTLARDD